MNNYDVWFNLAHPSNLVIEANSVQHASDLAEEILTNMDKDELINRIRDAIDYMGVEIVCVEKLIEC